MITAILIVVIAGIMVIAGLLIAECVAERRHQKWMAERGYNTGRKRS
jgi:hypothetical protein